MKRNILVVRALLGISLAAATAAASAEALAAQTEVVSLDIKSQPMTAALNEFGRQTGLQVLFYSDVADGVKKAPALTGAFTPEEALTQLLSNTGLMYSYINARTVAIHRAVSNVSESETRSEPERPVMRLANDVRMVGETEGEQIQGSGKQTVRDRGSEETRPDRNTRMEEVIVTARKREENIQDVPISIAVVSADEIDRRGLVNAEDYLRGIPGVNQVDARNGQAIIIRGVETTTADQNFGTGTTVATYFGETPTTATAGTGGGSNIDLKLVDVERVEVLRGPQGTAFGSSSMGGAVRIIPVEPRLHRFEGKVAAGYSVTSDSGGDNYNVEGVANVPIGDRLAVRATAYQFQDSGFYRNAAGSDPNFQSTIVARYGAQASAVDEKEVGAYYALGARIATLLQVSDDLQVTLTYLGQKTERDGTPLANSGTYEQTLLGVAPEHVARGESGGRFDTDIDIANATMEYNVGWGNLLATYSDIKSGSIQSIPFGSFSSSIPVSYGAHSDHRERVGEVRLTTDLSGAWDFLLGVYAEELKDKVLYDYLWHADPATNNLAPGERFVAVYPDSRELKQTAAFGEASWEFLRGLTLTGGVRAYEYDRTRQVDASGAFYGASGIHVRADTETSGANFRANLSYRPDADRHLYIGWSQGFRLGQPQTGVPSGACDRDTDGIIDGTNITVESTRHLSSDDVDSYELGGKFALLDHRLMIDAAIFRMEWSEIPVRVTTGSTAETCSLLSYSANVGQALSEGVEFQATFQITEPLRVDVGGSWAHARLTEDVPAQGFFSGDRLPGSPELSVNLGFEYALDIGVNRAYLRADSIYVGSFYGDILESPNTKAGDYLKLDLSARVPFGNLNFDLFVRNLTNEDAFTFRGPSAGLGDFFGYRLRPRTIGIALGYAF